MYKRQQEQLTLKEDRDGLINWYQQYTNVLIGDYLLRNNLSLSNKLGDTTSKLEEENSGVTFLKQQHLEKLLDYDVLLTANKIANSLVEFHDLSPLLTWINENKNYLKKNRCTLEFETRFQEHIELLKKGLYREAIDCYQTYLIPFIKDNFNDLKLAAGLLMFIQCFGTSVFTNEDNNLKKKSNDNVYELLFHKKMLNENPNVALINENGMKFCYDAYDSSRYKELLSVNRWHSLKNYFLKEYYSMYGISTNDPLLIYLSLGISTLKTKACLHENNNSISTNQDLFSYVNNRVINNKCPVCSDSFAKMSESLPYAHHTESKLFENPIMLPNGNIYDSKKLKELAVKLKESNLCNLNENEIMDPIDKRIYPADEFITMYPT